jgi:hypothetical protein
MRLATYKKMNVSKIISILASHGIVEGGSISFEETIVDRQPAVIITKGTRKTVVDGDLLEYNPHSRTSEDEVAAYIAYLQDNFTDTE